MSPLLQVGLEFDYEYTVPRQALVPEMYDVPSARDMPPVLSTGYMVGIMEFACLEATKPYLDWPREQSLGTLVQFSHLAATPAGMKIKVQGKLVEMQGKRLRFEVKAWDEHDQITEGIHERVVIDAERFQSKIAAKLSSVSPGGQR
jgi:fluoroacetyl-CoA thioesterase